MSEYVALLKASASDFSSAVAARLPESARTVYEQAMAAGDPRVKGALFLDPIQCLALIAVYLLTIGVLVAWIKGRKAAGKPDFVLKGPMLLHNLFLTGLSLYMCVECIRQAYLNFAAPWGNGVQDSGVGMAAVLHIYFLSKISEFLDTVFMALRGKFNQITFLHLYHHGSIFFVWWAVVWFAPGGDSYFSAALNSWIHVMMYGYYLWAAAAGKRDVTRKPRWNEPWFWRQYITRSQLLQFVIMFVQGWYVYLVIPDEFYPQWIALMLVIYMCTMLTLFGNFYVKAYAKKGKKGAKKSQ